MNNDDWADFRRKYPSRSASPARDSHVASLLKRLAELEEKTDPRDGDKSAKNKDFEAYTALYLAGNLVRTVAGWALDHQHGLALRGLSSVGPGFSGSDVTNSEYVEARRAVDSHEHECAGAAAPEFAEIDGEVGRRLLINLLLSNAGGFPHGLRVSATEALTALEFGEVLPLLEPRRRGLKATYRHLLLELRAICFVEYRSRGGLKKIAALQDVAAEYGVSPDTLRGWGIHLREQLGRLMVSAALRQAQKTAERASATRKDNGWEARGLRETADLTYGDDALRAAGARYRQLKGSADGE